MAFRFLKLSLVFQDGGCRQGGLREREVCDLKRVQIERGLPCHGMCWSDVAWPRDHLFLFVRSLEPFNLFVLAGCL